MRQRPPDHHGYRGLVDHFITAWRGKLTISGRRYRRGGYYTQFGRTSLRRSVRWCDDCLAADARDARLTRMHTAYRRRNR